MKIHINKIRLAATAAVLGAAAFLVMWAGGIFTADSRADILRIVSDGCFVSGAIALGVTVLAWLGGQGSFDALAFTTKTLLSLKWSVFGDYRTKYLEYKENKKPASFKWELLISGLIYLLAALILVLVWSNS